MFSFTGTFYPSYNYVFLYKIIYKFNLFRSLFRSFFLHITSHKESGLKNSMACCYKVTVPINYNV